MLLQRQGGAGVVVWAAVAAGAPISSCAACLQPSCPTPLPLPAQASLLRCCARLRSLVALSCCARRARHFASSCLASPRLLRTALSRAPALAAVVCRLSSVVCRLSSVVCRLSSVVVSSVGCRMSSVRPRRRWRPARRDCRAAVGLGKPPRSTKDECASLVRAV